MPDTKALVLGGGGVTGIAWSLGLLAGLHAGGLNLDDADLVVGTSAGSTVGAQLTSGADLEELYARELAGTGTEHSARIPAMALLRMAFAAARPGDSAQARAKVGKAALTADTVPEDRRRAIIAARLPVTEWPPQRLLITAVDAESGAFTAFDAASGVSLVDAVTASCAVSGVWPPASINGRRWIDGGTRSNLNVDLASECRRVLVIAPMAFGAARAVRKLGVNVRSLVVAPDAAARKAIGRNPLDPARRAPSARAGRAQAVTAAEAISSLWRD